MMFVYLMWVLVVYFVYIFTFIFSFISSHFIIHVFFRKDIIVQVIIGESLKALMLLCRGNLSDADVIVYIVVINLYWHRCYGAEVLYLVFSSGMENRTLSQICGRLYLPMFLLRVGLLTLM